MTADAFTVAVSSPNIPVIAAGPVAFHGVNKSGSLAMANVLRESYYAADRANQFFSVYHGVPRHLEDICTIVRHSTGHNFFVAHNLFRAVEIPSSGAMVTQVRHPLSRTLSIWGWMKRNHLNRHKTLEGLPTLDRWVRALKGYKHTQMYQLAFGFPDGLFPAYALDVPLQDVYDMAAANLVNDFAWFGIAELFEESIFAMAHICGLGTVYPWQKDTRNQWRDPVEGLDDETVEVIRSALRFEFAFYDHALDVFRGRLEKTVFGPTLLSYKERCVDEYGERLIER